MKTKKNFLKKLTAGILGFVMTLGVGAAGYAGAVYEGRAEAATIAGYTNVYTNPCPKSTSNTGYANSYSVTVGDVSWQAAGNQFDNGDWRCGGKTSNNGTRLYYTKTPISKVDKITIKLGTSSLSSFTPKLTVHNSANDAESGNNAIATFTSGFATSTTNSFDATSTWENKYYRLAIAVVAGSSSNRYLSIQEIAFYKKDSSGTVTGVSVSKGSLVGNYKGSAYIQCSAEVSGTGSYEKGVEWSLTSTSTYSASSTSTTIASIDANGKVVFKDNGDAYVWATSTQTSSIHNTTVVKVTASGLQDQPSFVKATSLSDLSDGCLGVITSSNGSLTLGGQNSNNRKAIDSGITDSTIPVSDSIAIIRFNQVPNTNFWTLYVTNINEGYLYAVSGQNYLRSYSTADEDDSYWTISFDENENANILCDNLSRTIRYNSSSSIFAAYGSGQGAVCIYCQPAIPTTYTISYDSGIGEGSHDPDIVDIGESISLPTGDDFSLVGHSLAGWALEDGGDLVDDPYTPESDVTLIAQYDPVELTIDYDLVDVISSNTDSSILYGGSYTSRLSVGEGYAAPVVEVLMNKVDITEVCYSNYVINIEEVTGDLEITAYSSIVSTFSITYPSESTHVNHTGDVSEVNVGDSFTTTLIPETCYGNMQVEVQMGGTDVTSDVYSQGVVTIEEVTGDVVISASVTLLCDFTVDTSSISEFTGAASITRIVTAATDWEGDVIFTWSSSNSGVASVSETPISSQDGLSAGVIQINSAGEAKIYIDALDEGNHELRKTINVSVTNSSSTLSIDKTELVVDQGGTGSITPEVSDIHGYHTNKVTITYSSSYFSLKNGDVTLTSGAEVDSGTTITVVGGENADKTGSNVTFSANGQTKTCLVKVFTDPYLKLTKLTSTADVVSHINDSVFYLGYGNFENHIFAGKAIPSGDTAGNIPVSNNDFSTIFEFELITSDVPNQYYVKYGNLYLNNNSSTGMILQDEPSSHWSLDTFSGAVILRNESNKSSGTARHIGAQLTDGSPSGFRAYAKTSDNPPAYLYRAPADVLDSIAVSISDQDRSFIAGNQFSISGLTVTATYTISGSRAVTKNLKYYLGSSTTEMDPENFPILTKQNDNAIITVKYIDKVEKTATYTISVAYKAVTDISLNKNELELPLKGTDGNPGTETLTATVSDEYADPSVNWSVISGSSYIELVNVSDHPEQKTIKAKAEGTALVRATSVNSEIYDECEITVTADPVVSLDIVEITGKSSGMAPVTIHSTISNFGSGVTYLWSASPAGIVGFDSTSGANAAVSFLSGSSSNTTITLTVSDQGGKVASATCIVGPITQSGVTSFDITSSVSDGILYLGSSNHKSLTLTPSIETTGIANKNINWTVDKNDLVELSATQTADSGITITAKKSGDAVITATSAYDSSKSKTFTVHIVEDSVDGSLSWTSRGATEFWVGDKLKDVIAYTSWNFSAKMNSTETVSPTFGTGDDNVQIGLYDSKEPTTKSSNPLTEDYVFTKNDNGKYLVAYYKGAFSSKGTNQQITVKNWRSVIVGDTYSGNVTFDKSGSVYSYDQDTGLTLSGSASGNYYYCSDGDDSMRLGKSGGKGTYTLTSNRNITKVTVSAKGWDNDETKMLINDTEYEIGFDSYVTTTIEFSSSDNVTQLVFTNTKNTGRYNIASINIECSDAQEIGKTQKCLDAVAYVDEHLDSSSSTSFAEKKEAFNALTEDAKSILLDHKEFATEKSVLESLVTANSETIGELNGKTAIYFACETYTSLQMSYDANYQVTSVKIRYSITIDKKHLPTSDGLKLGFYYGVGSKEIDISEGTVEDMTSYLSGKGMTKAGEQSASICAINDHEYRLSFNINIPLTHLDDALTVAFYFSDGSNMFIGEKVTISARAVAQAKLAAGGLSELETTLYTNVAEYKGN